MLHGRHIVLRGPIILEHIGHLLGLAAICSLSKFKNVFLFTYSARSTYPVIVDQPGRDGAFTSFTAICLYNRIRYKFLVSLFVSHDSTGDVIIGIIRSGLVAVPPIMDIIGGIKSVLPQPVSPQPIDFIALKQIAPPRGGAIRINLSYTFRIR